MRHHLALLALVVAALLAVGVPAAAQDAYPPPEEPSTEEVAGEVLDLEEEVAEDAEDADVEVLGIELEREGALPVTGATLGVLAALALGAVALGGGLLFTSRRRRQHV